MGFKPATTEEKQRQHVRDLADIARATKKLKRIEKKKAAEAKELKTTFERERKASYRFRKKHGVLRVPLPIDPSTPDGNMSSSDSNPDNAVRAESRFGGAQQVESQVRMRINTSMTVADVHGETEQQPLPPAPQQGSSSTDITSVATVATGSAVSTAVRHPAV